jgi:hypothetical protein
MHCEEIIEALKQLERESHSGCSRSALTISSTVRNAISAGYYTVSPSHLMRVE